MQAMVLSWIPILYAMLLAACLTLATVHFLVWRKVRVAPGNLFFSLGASFVLSAMTFIELSMMRAQTVGEYGQLVRWMHVPVWTFFLIVIGFVHFHLRAGRRWLALTICALRTLSLTLNFLVGQNLNYLEITHLLQVPFLGNTVSIPVGVPNPWMLVGQASLLLLLVFIADAALALWRRGDRQLALVFGCSMTVFVAAPTVEGALIVLGILQWPPMVAPFFGPVMAAMCYEMSRSLVRSTWLADKLQATDSELQRSEQRLKLASESARLAVWEWNIDLDELWATPRGQAMFGIPPGGRTGFSRFLETVHPDDRDGLLEAVSRSRANRDHFDHEFRIMLADGQTRWVESRGQFNTDTAEDETIMRGVAFDITDTKQAEERFQRVVEASPIGKVISGPDGRIIYANPTAESYFGYPPAALIACSIETLLPAYHRAGDPTTTGAAIEVGDVCGRRMDGSEISLQMSLSLLPSPQGTLLLTTLVDISERKQREEQLWREKDFLRQVIDINPGLIFVKDREGRFTLANKTVADLYGTTPRELIGKTDADFNRPPDEAAACHRADREILAGNRERVTGEEQFTDAAGKCHWLQTIKRPLAEQGGTASQVLCVSTDITARKHSELEVERQRNELAHLSRVTMLSELSGSLAHELNQPLTAILSNAQAAQRFLARGTDNLDEIRDILTDIVSDDKRAGEVIRRLRGLLKKDEAQFLPIDLNEAVQDVHKLLRSDLLNRNVSIGMELSADLPLVSADRVLLQQVLLNLMMNGCEAMNGSGTHRREIVVRTAALADEVRISVADRGTGIPPAKLETIFESFYTTKDHGMGLGLSVCRSIVTSHRGRLWAENNPEGGASLHVALPLDAEGNRRE